MQVNRNTQHITEYTPYYIIYTRERSYYTHTRKQKKTKTKITINARWRTKKEKRRKCAANRRSVIHHVPPQHPHQQGKRTITQTADAGGLNVINHDHTLYRQISTCEENPTSPNGPNTHEAERDKSRPYTVRQMPTLSRLVEDTKLKGMFLITLSI